MSETRWSLRRGRMDEQVVFETNDVNELDRVGKELAKEERVGVFDHGVFRGSYSNRGVRVDRIPQAA